LLRNSTKDLLNLPNIDSGELIRKRELLKKTERIKKASKAEFIRFRAALTFEFGSDMVKMSNVF
jgi:hypothetical protein